MGMPIETSYADISSGDFKAGMRQLAAGVTVITAALNETKDGLTATATCSVSADPPQLLICVNQLAGAHNLIRDAGSFGVNILARDHEDIALRFAGMDDTEREDRFGLGTWMEVATGAPILKEALAGFDCTISEQVDAGTHSIFIGRIVGILHQQGSPLLYGNGAFTGLANQN
ncbi:MAG: flavin reductase family protein [Rhodospirillales bacterium]|nr:flavin reductase family protein [Rhodospirillales bacterium]